MLVYHIDDNIGIVRQYLSES